MKKILITGARGFVGTHLCLHLARRGWNVYAAVRSGTSDARLAKHTTLTPIDDIAAEKDWSRSLSGMEAVVHLAARVHVMHRETSDALAEYRRINTAATEALAGAAARQGVGNFVFLSTIKVNGERTVANAYSEADVPEPLDPYATSKWEAEQALTRIAAETSMAITILRPPLIYGPGVKGNFLRLLKLISRGMPLPLASVKNIRSFLFVDNLVSAIEASLTVQHAGAETFLLSDDRDLSTPQIIALLAAALKVKPHLYRCPPALLQALATIAGKGGEVTRMVESLSVDCSKIKQQLQWAPPFTVEQGLDATARWFIDGNSSNKPGS